MVLSNILYPILRQKTITSQAPLAFNTVLSQSVAGVGSFQSSAENNYNSSNTNDPQLLTAIQTLGTDVINISGVVQTFQTGITPTRNYPDIEATYDTFKSLVTTTNVFNSLKKYTDYHVSTLTDNASDFILYSRDDWLLGRNNNSLMQSTLRRQYESHSNVLLQLATLILDTSTDPLYQSIHHLNAQLLTTLASIQSTGNVITTIRDKLENGIETTLADIALLKSKYEQVSTNLNESSVRLGLIFTGGSHSLDKTS